jgi:hypothetical protein
MLNQLSLTQAFLATLRPGGSFEITFYKYLIKFLAKGHSSHQSLYEEETFIFFSLLWELFKEEQVVCDFDCHRED